MKALIVVDMQNDFITGSFVVPRAQEIVGPIQDYIRDLLSSKHSAFIAFTGCAHPPNHMSFVEYGGQWPTHCIRGTRGADQQFGLQMIQRAYQMPVYLKGTQADKEEYSAFENLRLVSALSIADVKEIEVCGLARPYCVDATAKAAEDAGYRVSILDDLCRSIPGVA